VPLASVGWAKARVAALRSTGSAGCRSRQQCRENAPPVAYKKVMDARLRQGSLPQTWAKFAQSQPIAAAAIAIAGGGAATVLGAWFFQFGLGLTPCPLCLSQRYPSDFAISLALTAVAAWGFVKGFQSPELSGGR